MRRSLAWLLSAALVLAPVAASAQSSPNWAYSFVPSPGAWNTEWASKADFPVQLATGITGTLPIANGGTGVTNPAVTIGSTTISLGATATTLAGLLLTNPTASSLVIPNTSAGISQTFTGSGAPALMWFNQTSNAASATEPEIGGQFTINSNVGAANFSTAYKIGGTASAICGPSSASCYGMNVITQGYAGTYLLTGVESDLNNIGANATSLGAGTAAYGFVGVAAGNFESTAGLWLTSAGGGSGWNLGVAVTNAADASYFENSSATYGVQLAGTHTSGIDMRELTGGGFLMTLPNNQEIADADSGGTLRNLIFTDNTNEVHVGDPGLAGVQIYGTHTSDVGAAGTVGEPATGFNTTPVPMTTNTPVNIASVPLSAGNWNCSASIQFATGALNLTSYTAGLSPTTGTLPSFQNGSVFANLGSASGSTAVAAPVVPETLASPTTIFLVAEATFASSTVSGTGSIRCTRIR